MIKLLPTNYTFDKKTTLCFTGHRSQKLPWGFNENDPRRQKVKVALTKEIEKSICQGYVNFLCGMALGFDLMCAEVILELKNKYPQIKLIAAVPCKNQQSKWPLDAQKRYVAIAKQVDAARCKYDSYTGSECMLERNSYMINNSSKVIALYNGQPGGTQSTLHKAKQSGLEIIIISPNQ